MSKLLAQLDEPNVHLLQARRRGGRSRLSRVRRNDARGLVALIVAGLLLVGAHQLRLLPDLGGSSFAASSGSTAMPTQPRDVSPVPLGTPPPRPEGEGGYAFSAEQPNGRPVTWDPCRPIRYVVRPDNQPPWGPAALDTAIAEISRTTGLRFINDGTTDEAPDDDRPAYQLKRYGDRWAPLLITWTSASESNELTGDVGGRGGAVEVYDADGGGASRYVSGGLEIDVQDMLRAEREGAPVGLRQTLLLHELGHVVGLGHVNDARSVMHESSDVTKFSPGDLRGLHDLGRGDCRPHEP